MIAYVLARPIYAWQAGRRDVQRTEKRKERMDSKAKRINKFRASFKGNVVREKAERNANNNDTKCIFTRF
jgi:hypothetical protein